MSRLPSTRSLSEILPKGRDGGNEFARIVDLLLFYDARHVGETIDLFSDRSGDWNGLDSFTSGSQRIKGNIGYQYKFFPSPLSSNHRSEIEAALKKAAAAQKTISIKKWVIVTPDDLSESARKKGGGDVSWFNSLRQRLRTPFEVEHWGHAKLQGLFLQAPALCLFYYPDLVVDGRDLKTAITNTRRYYDTVLNQKFGRIEFVGMSVRKEEASRGVKIGDIYIPLATVAEGTDPSDLTSSRSDPLGCINPGQRTVVLGDPGSGKSTLLRFFALVGKNSALQDRCKAKRDDRLPILVTLRKYADELKSNFNLPIVDFIVQTLKADFSNPNITIDFLTFYLESGQAILLFDGVDELPDTRFKLTIRDRIQALTASYPGNAIVVTSRIVGYEQEARFGGECPFEHCQVAPLRGPEIAQFALEWHKARIEDPREQDRMLKDLMSVLDDAENHAISELACNPLLLTIIVLVHRIDAVLPDQRVLLYQKCVETLLITWHTWKYRASLPKRPDREDRRNLRRMEAIAEWMHNQAGGEGREQRAVVSFQNIVAMLGSHIRDIEQWPLEKGDPEDEAAEFLSFVRQKAGLLVEAGADLYSFVHLTFQEYLAARHIITCSESRGGDTFVWAKLKDRVNVPRWSEVTRLLVAARDSEESQRNLVQLILLAASTSEGVAISAVLGGLLLDRVPAAEEQRLDILRLIVRTAGKSGDDAAILVGMLANLVHRPENASVFDESLKHAWEDLKSDSERKSLILAVLATSYPDTLLVPWLEKLKHYDPVGVRLVSDLDTFDGSTGSIPKVQARWDNLARLLVELAQRSPDTNLLAAIACSAFPLQQSRLIFAIQLSMMTEYSEARGPFTDFTANLLSLHPHDQFKNVWHLAGNRNRRKNPTFERLSEVFHDLRRAAPNRKINRTGHRSGALVHKLDIAGLNLDRHRGQSRAKFWGTLMSHKETQEAILNILISGLNLKPKFLWSEALRGRLLAKLGRRSTVFEKDPFSPQECSPADQAVWLMADLWYYCIGGYHLPEESPLALLEKQNLESEVPILRFVVLLRASIMKVADVQPLVRLANDSSTEVQRLLAFARWERLTTEVGANLTDVPL